MSSALRRRALLLLGLSAGATGLARQAAPSRHLAHERSPRPLAAAVPERVVGWAEDRSVTVLEPSPDVRADLARVYRDLLTRTYTDSGGYRVMLSIAYSGDQSDGMSVHRPEVCYPAQGFELLRARSELLRLDDRRIPVRRLSTRLGSRFEPLTYWVVNGQHVVASTWEGRLRQLRSTLSGTVPDGMLVRLSSLDGDDTRAFERQDHQARALVAALDDEIRPRLVGAHDASH